MNGVWYWDEHFSLSAFLYIFIVNSMTILLKIEYPLKEIESYDNWRYNTVL